MAIRLPKHTSTDCTEIDELSPEQLLWQHRRGDLLLSIPTYQALVWLMEHGGLPATETIDSEMHQYHQGLSILPLPAPALPPITHVNCYILGKKYLTLVDPGCREHDVDASGVSGRALLQRALEQRISRGAVVKDIWITHHHPDHHAAAAWLRDTYGARLWAHAQVAEMLPELRIDGLLNEGVPYWVDAKTTETTVWYPMLTPGHAPGHLCFYQPDIGALLTGDMLLGHGNTFVPPRPLGSVRDYCHALERLNRLNARHFLCGHGPPLGGENNPIAQQLYHRRRRLQQIWQCLERPSGFAEVFQRIYGHIEPLRSQLAEKALLAYLESLVEEGVVAYNKESLYVRTGST
jgi:glyoxylase-like metal-dependent hydrolase (beta-lactamase superfamily II)